MPVRVVVTEGTRADCPEAEGLIDGFNMGYLLADKGYDSDVIVAKAKEQGARVVIPPRKNRLSWGSARSLSETVALMTDNKKPAGSARAAGGRND